MPRTSKNHEARLVSIDVVTLLTIYNQDSSSACSPLQEAALVYINAGENNV